MRSRPTPLLAGAAICLAGLTTLAAPAGAVPAGPVPAATTGGGVYLVQGVDGTAMTLRLDDKVVAASAPAKKVVGPITVSPGSHTVTATPASGTPVTATITVKSGSSTDVVLHRQADVNQPPVFTAYANNLSAVTQGSGRLTVAHVAAVGPADIRVKGKVLFSNVANGEELTLTVPAGTYPVDIVPTATDGPVVFGPADVPVKAGTLTRVFAIGVAATNSMDAVVQVLPVASRGGGEVVSRVDAGDGGQAQTLIRRHETASPGAANGSRAATTGWLLAAALLAAGAVGVVVRRRVG